MISATQFTHALNQLPTPTDGQRSFLQAHADAPARTSTATVLAQKADYENYNGINLQYGLLAAAVGQALQLGTDPGLSLLVDFVKPETVTNEHWLLVMKAEFADGLKAAGWIHEPRPQQ